MHSSGVEVLALAADPELLFDGPADGARTIALAHGAGADHFQEAVLGAVGVAGASIIRTKTLTNPVLWSK